MCNELKCSNCGAKVTKPFYIDGKVYGVKCFEDLTGGKYNMKLLQQFNGSTEKYAQHMEVIEANNAKQEQEKVQNEQYFKEVNAPFIKFYAQYIQEIVKDRRQMRFMKNIKQTLTCEKISSSQAWEKEKLADMAGKTQGRRNSKAYEATYNKVIEVIESI